jgi:hypothetical protein
MEELSNLLKLKEENRLLKEENTLLKSDLKKIKGRFDDSISSEKTSLKVIELKKLLEKYRKEKIDLQKKILDAENFSDKMFEKILLALANGSYEITGEDFILNFSETRLIKVDIDAIFKDIKDKVLKKYNTIYELKRVELDKLINKNLQKEQIIKKANRQYEILYNQKIDKLQREYNKKISDARLKYIAEVNSIGKNNNDQISPLSGDQKYIPILKKEYEKLKMDFDEISRSIDPLKSSMNLLKVENSELKKEKHNLSVLLGTVEKKLQNCQKELSKYLTKSSFNSSTSILKTNIEDMNMGINSDGSKGWHDIARETGRFGSLPSFDNYDDDYLDNSKEGFE